MPKKDDGMVHLRGVIKSISPQTAQYKPFAYELGFDGQGGDCVAVDIEIPALDVVQSDKDCVVIDLDGFKALLLKVAETLDEVEASYKKKFQR